MGAVVELIHAATLVHDDVIDAAQTRRGRPSTNVQWGNHTCVLAGDWLYMQAFQIALRERNFHVLDLLIGLTQMMVEGELLQLERIGRIDVTEADCMELVDRKTACLFTVCAKLGALWWRADSQTREARQIRLESGDGIPVSGRRADFTAREKHAGKPVGGDLREGKSRCPWCTRSSAARDERRSVERVLADRHYATYRFAGTRADRKI
jgi:octaprenyl-diphosphate synthase